MSRLLASALSILLALAAAVPAAADPPGDPEEHPCVDQEDSALPLTLEVGGAAANGHYARPAAMPTQLVVFAHGYGHTSRSWKEHMRRVATDLGVLAVAMDYRGTTFDPAVEIPSSRGWRVAEGAADSIAAARHFEALCGGFETVVLFSVSMGSNAAGLALAAQPASIEGGPLFDWWLNLEGAANVVETYFEARTLAPANSFAKNAAEDIEAEMGGTYEQKPDVYRDHAVVNRVPEIAASGVRGVYMVHGPDDGLIPYNQAVELAALLEDAGVKREFVTIPQRGAGESGTTVTGTAINNVDKSYESPLAGHASERSTTHVIMKAGFDRLRALLVDGKPICSMDSIAPTFTLTRNCAA